MNDSGIPNHDHRWIAVPRTITDRVVPLPTVAPIAVSYGAISTQCRGCGSLIGLPNNLRDGSAKMAVKSSRLMMTRSR
jgi:hypothetical protein